MGINLYKYAENNPVNYFDPFGLDVKFDPNAPQALKDAYDKVKATPRGKELCNTLENEKDKTYTIKATKDDAYFDPKDNTINIDPNFHPPTDTTAGVQPAPTDAIMGHELGHAATGTKDDGPGNMNNVKQNENPIRQSLGEPERKKY